jgi:hypothetical protein
MKGKLVLIGFCLMLVTLAAWGQTGTPHGILWTITPPNPVGGTGTIQGYYLFTCAGANCTNYVSVGALIPAASQTGPTTYQQPASGLNTNTTYEGVAVTVDSNGNQSAYSPVATVVVGSFPTNPGPPGCQGKVQ